MNNYDRATELWRLAAEYIKELRQRGEHEAAERVKRTALEDIPGDTKDMESDGLCSVLID